MVEEKRKWSKLAIWSFVLFAIVIVYWIIVILLSKLAGGGELTFFMGYAGIYLTPPIFLFSIVLSILGIISIKKNKLKGKKLVYTIWILSGIILIWWLIGVIIYNSSF